MNVDELRTALREPAPVPLHVDLGRVVTRGRRRRAVRRGAVPLAVVATAVAVTVPTLVLGDDPSRSGAGRPAATSSGAPAPDATAPGTGSTPAPARDRPATDPTDGGDARPVWGTVVRTGYQAPGTTGERVVWFVRVTDAQLPGVDLAVVVGHLAGGRPVADAATNSVDAAPRSPGFHALGSSDGVVEDGRWLLVGYYSGPVARATVDVAGRTMPLRVAPWSVDPSIAAVWLDASSGLDAPAQDSFTRFRAYDRASRPLPAGDATVGVG